jgi:hypothetical protein
MYLVHITYLKNLNKILKSGELLSNALSKKIELGSGIYTQPNKFVYLSVQKSNKTNPKPKFDKTGKIKYVKLYFSLDILLKKQFYTSSTWSPEPNYIATWKIGRYTYKKRMYKNIKTTKRIKKILLPILHLYLNQVAIKNRLKLNKYFTQIEFLNSNPSKQILKLLNKKYPNTKVRIHNNN